MSTVNHFVGTRQHQQILATITNFYEEDVRTLAVLLFGSLSRGNWDQYSDIDLDIIMDDGTVIDARVELQKLCAAIKQKHGYDAIIIADEEEGDVVLSNLVEFSIRYHILSDTKPAILDSMQLLSGSLSLDEIRVNANDAYRSEPKEIVELIDACLRYALGLYHAIKRKRIWMAMEMLHRIRALLMSMVAVTHGVIRPIHCFDANATPKLHQLLVTLSPQPDLQSVTEAFHATLFIVENRLEDVCGESYRMTPSQKAILDKLKQFLHPQIEVGE